MTENKQLVPAGLGLRFVALFVDGLIVAVATVPLSMFVALVQPILLNGLQPGDTGYFQIVLLVNGISWIINSSITFLYHGYFYQKKGATPGKSLMGLVVLDSETGTNLTWKQTLIREPIGKFISGLAMMFFLAGFFIPFFRNDKKAIHDMMAKSQVFKWQNS